MFLNTLEEGEIVGSVRAYLERGTVYIGRLMVKPDSQNNGIGTRLMQAIEDHFRMADRYELFTFLSFIISGLRSGFDSRIVNMNMNQSYCMSLREDSFNGRCR